jgi:hypothetical protein
MRPIEPKIHGESRISSVVPLALLDGDDVDDMSSVAPEVVRLLAKATHLEEWRNVLDDSGFDQLRGVH